MIEFLNKEEDGNEVFANQLGDVYILSRKKNKDKISYSFYWCYVGTLKGKDYFRRRIYF